MALIFDQAAISRVQQASDIVEVVGEHLNLVKKGREMVGLCPFHEDHRPSLYVNPTKQIFKCFACGAGGDVFKFLQMRENLTFPQAVERLAHRAGIQLMPRASAPSAVRADDINPNDLARVNDWADRFFQKCLCDPKAKPVMDYLQKRQINDKSIEMWHIGYAPPGGAELVAAAERSGIDEKLLIGSGLVVRQNSRLTDKFVNRLMFTITDVTGRTIGFGGRNLDGIGAKYINSPTTALFDKSNCLYGLNHARLSIGKSSVAVVVEGYTDVIMAHQFSFDNVVATLGTSLTQGHARILKRYAKAIILFFDSDTAGVTAANRALELCLSQRLDIKVTSVPQGKDPCDFLLAEGADAFAEVLSNAVDVFQFKWQRLLNTFNADDTITGRKTAVDEFLQSVAAGMLSGNIGAIERGIIINRLANIISLDTASVNNHLNRLLRAAKRAKAYDNEKQKDFNIDLGRGLFAVAQREIIEVLLNEPAMFEIVHKKVGSQDFDVPALRQAAEIIFNIIAENPNAQITQVLACIEEPRLAAAVVRMQQTGQEKGNFLKRLEDAIGVFEKNKPGDTKRATDKKHEKIDIKQLAEKAQKGNPHTLGMT